MQSFRAKSKSVQLVLVVMLVLASVARINGASGAQYLCGSDFIYAFEQCCSNKYPECIKNLADPVHMQRRAVYPFMSPKMAKVFMKKTTKRQFALNSPTERNTNPPQECCEKQCTYEEVAEYPCF